MLTWPRPLNKKALKDFLGLIEYYRKFIKNYDWANESNLNRSFEEKWIPLELGG